MPLSLIETRQGQTERERKKNYFRPFAFLSMLRCIHVPFFFGWDSRGFLLLLRLMLLLERNRCREERREKQGSKRERIWWKSSSSRAESRVKRHIQTTEPNGYCTLCVCVCVYVASPAVLVVKEEEEVGGGAEEAPTFNRHH